MLTKKRSGTNVLVRVHKVAHKSVKKNLAFLFNDVICLSYRRLYNV